MKKQVFLYLFFSVFALAGLASGAIGIWLLNSRYQIKSAGEKTMGKVIDLSHSESMTSPIVGFKDRQGRNFVFHSSQFTNIDPYKLGDEVTIYYNPSNPDDAILEGEGWSSLIPLLLFFTHGGVGFGGLIWLERKRRIRKWLLEQGQEILAVFVRVEEKDNKGRNYTPIFEWKAPETQVLHVFKGNTGSSDPLQFISLGTAVKVLIDPANPKHYLVDQSFMEG